MYIFYSNKVPSSAMMCDQLLAKGQKIQKICIDDKRNRENIKKYRITKIPTIITDTGKIEGKACTTFLNSLQKKIDGYSTHDISNNYADPANQMKIEVVPDNGQNFNSGPINFLIPSTLLGTEFKSIEDKIEDTVRGNVDYDYNRKMQELMRERE